MFGDSSFAQAPFAALPITGTVFVIFISENNNLADVLATNFAALESITESTSLKDNITQQNNLLFSITEPTSINDPYTVIFHYLYSISENVITLDNLCYRGWFKINDSQVPNWNAISIPSGTWNNINISQTPTWGNIDTKQTCS